MNENDKGGGSRRRSSRRRGGRSTGKQAERGEALQRQTAASRMGEDRPSATDRSDRARSERARRGERRAGQGNQQSRRAAEQAQPGAFDRMKTRAAYPDRPRWKRSLW